ncbi:MAG: hypothetical protein J2P58_12680, partial [Acidimicrobiaceae bacterium]|nr:hypothetical protein [Acidimicrobiaceae bacterium]
MPDPDLPQAEAPNWVAASPPHPASSGAATHAVRAWVADLEPGYFACVMATGIVSVSTELLHRHVLSVILLVVTAAAFALLG